MTKIAETLLLQKTTQMNKTLTQLFDSFCESRSQKPENGLRSYYKDVWEVYESKIIPIELDGTLLFGAHTKNGIQKQILAYLPNKEDHPEGKKYKNLSYTALLIIQEGNEKPKIYPTDIPQKFDTPASPMVTAMIRDEFKKWWPL